ncbi:UNKNOWN [Stylonychia lemnae]|uniref:Uncharacterized protein n=1 Tax=Stylonychia lemnae TaxID=5949 RepID=A0A078BDB5_STYLE|nr:UNKNOWN [Stylonychia lemnae]|eukprot:CDW91197.1 UNKNOWN [Stylonychia lemnae]
MQTTSQIAKQLTRQRSLLQQASRSFSQQTFLGSINPDRNHNLRVMATPEWPVPYYQRAFRHPVSVEKRVGSFEAVVSPLHDFHAVLAKEILKSSGKGYVVEAIENHYDLATYKTEFKDCTQYCRAYIEDLAEALGVAHEQNSRILNEHDLSECLN